LKKYPVIAWNNSKRRTANGGPGRRPERQEPAGVLGRVTAAVTEVAGACLP